MCCFLGSNDCYEAVVLPGPSTVRAPGDDTRGTRLGCSSLTSLNARLGWVGREWVQGGNEHFLLNRKYGGREGPWWGGHAKERQTGRRGDTPLCALQGGLSGKEVRGYTMWRHWDPMAHLVWGGGGREGAVASVGMVASLSSS